MTNLDLISNKQGFVGPSFSLANRIKRLLWQFVWLVAARWTPAPLHKWRILILRVFGAKVSYKAYVYSNIKVWAPWNLTIDDYGTLASDVNCYNIAEISIGKKAVVSQSAYLCSGSHAYRDPAFPLIAKPIHIGDRAWICARAFVGPGVTVGDGAVLAGASVTFRNLDAWRVYMGNPATIVNERPIIQDYE